jgi:hypothetical protein
MAGIVYIGTGKEKPADRKRPDIDAIVTRWISDDENATAGEPNQ